MRRMNNLLTLFSAMFAFFFGCFLSLSLTNNNDNCLCSNNKMIITSNLKNPNNVFLMVLILTAPTYFERRAIIRDTWLKLPKSTFYNNYPEELIYIPNYNKFGFLLHETVHEQSNRTNLYQNWYNQQLNTITVPGNFHIKHVFSIGTKGLSATLIADLHKEQNIHNDLLLLDELYDSYSNLTMKLKTSIEKLTNQYKYVYLLKTDDDTYVKLDLLKNELIAYDKKLQKNVNNYHENPIPNLYWGYFNGKANIKTKGQWKEIHYNLCSRYIPYALGGGYIINRNIAEYITQNSKFLSLYVSEDVSMGTWLSPLRNIYKKHDIRFDTGYLPRKCKTYHYVLHKRTEIQMKDLYHEKLCTFELLDKISIRRPIEYYYDWSQTPDKCCDILA